MKTLTSIMNSSAGHATRLKLDVVEGAGQGCSVNAKVSPCPGRQSRFHNSPAPRVNAYVRGQTRTSPIAARQALIHAAI